MHNLLSSIRYKLQFSRQQWAKARSDTAVAIILLLELELEVLCRVINSVQFHVASSNQSGVKWLNAVERQPSIHSHARVHALQTQVAKGR